MEIKSNNVWLNLSYYASVVNPTNLCSLFWRGIWGILYIITAPLAFLIITASAVYKKRSIGNTFNSVHDSNNIPRPLLWLLSNMGLIAYLISLIGFITVFYDSENEFDYLFTQAEWWVFIIAPIVFVVFLAVIGVIVFLLITGFDYFKDRGVSILPKYLEAYKNKICPLIEINKNK